MVKSPKSLGLPYDSWRSNQHRALEALGKHGEGLLCLQAPTGSGKTGIALAWGLSSSDERTLILTQRNTELTQYEKVVGFEHPDVAFIRGQRHYHCLLRGDKDDPRKVSALPEEPCQSDKPHCDLAECEWPRFDDSAPCHDMKKPQEECPFYSECPYIVARGTAREANVVVTNYRYGIYALWLDNIVGEFDRLVADEAHDLLSILTDICTLQLNLRRFSDALTQILRPNDYDVVRIMAEQRARRAGRNPASSDFPAFYNSARTRVAEEINICREAIEGLVNSCRQSVQAERPDRTLLPVVDFAQRFRTLAGEIRDAFTDDADMSGSEKRLSENVRARYYELCSLADLPSDLYDNLVPPADFQPDFPRYAPVDLRRSGLARRRFWNRTACSLAMSGTLPQYDALGYSLGLEEMPQVLRLPQEFLPERRPVYVWSKELDLKFETGYQDLPLLHRMVDKLLENPRLSAGKGIVLWPSYRWMHDYLEHLRVLSVVQHQLLYHTSSEDANDALEQFKEAAGPTILMSPTAYQAIDLPDDACRFIVIVRPFWPVTSPGTLDWYRRQRLPGFMPRTAGLKMIQAAGRGFRNEDDWCEVYVVDKGQGDSIVRELRNPDYGLKVHRVSDLLAPAYRKVPG